MSRLVEQTDVGCGTSFGYSRDDGCAMVKGVPCVRIAVQNHRVSHPRHEASLVEIPVRMAKRLGCRARM